MSQCRSQEKIAKHFQILNSHELIVKLGVPVSKSGVADITGRIVYDEQISCAPGENKMNIVLPEVNQGIYNLIISKGEESISQKILVQ